MPLKMAPHDFEYMSHPFRSAPTPGKPKVPRDRQCRKKMELGHNHPEYGRYDPQFCDLEVGHIGRHEFHYDNHLFASWADRPE